MAHIVTDFALFFGAKNLQKWPFSPTRYLRYLKAFREVHKTKKLDFGLNFIIPGVPDSEN